MICPLYSSLYFAKISYRGKYLEDWKGRRSSSSRISEVDRMRGNNAIWEMNRKRSWAVCSSNIHARGCGHCTQPLNEMKNVLAKEEREGINMGTQGFVLLWDLIENNNCEWLNLWKSPQMYRELEAIHFVFILFISLFGILLIFRGLLKIARLFLLFFSC